MAEKIKSEAILVFGAHSDDFVIGAGGTIAKYAKEKKKVISLVFSYGEKSHPWLKAKVAKKMRSEEAFQASRILGCRTSFFDLREFNFLKDYREKELEKKLTKLIEKQKPSKLFTHSPDDPHPDHLAVYKITLELWEKLPKPRPEVYAYSIWNPLALRTSHPVLYEDITSTFSLKIQALKAFKSQKLSVLSLSLPMFYRAVINGLKIRKRFAEKFNRIR